MSKLIKKNKTRRKKNKTRRKKYNTKNNKNKTRKFLKGGVNGEEIQKKRELHATAAEERIKKNEFLEQLQKLAKNPKENLDIKKIYDLLVKNKEAKNAPEIFTVETLEVLKALANRKLKIESPLCQSVDGPIGTLLLRELPRLDASEDTDCWKSIEPYLADVESTGPDEVESGSFQSYTLGGIDFLLILLEENSDGLKNKTRLCIPPFYLCVYRKRDTDLNVSHKYEIITKGDLSPCAETDIDDRILMFDGLEWLYASMILLNAPIGAGWNPLESRKQMELFYPANLIEIIDRCKKNDPKRPIVLFQLLLVGRKGVDDALHSNIILFDLENETIERFDPHGGSEYKEGDEIKSSDAYYNQLNIDLKLYETFIAGNKFLDSNGDNIFRNFSYIGANRICPFSVGPQSYVDYFEGLCATWTIMYILLRILNPDLPQEEITNIMTNQPRKKILNILLRFNRFIADKLRSYSKEAVNAIKIKNLIEIWGRNS